MARIQSLKWDPVTTVGWRGIQSLKWLLSNTRRESMRSKARLEGPSANVTSIVSIRRPSALQGFSELSLAATNPPALHQMV